jgi:hypothetical protein
MKPVDMVFALHTKQLCGSTKIMKRQLLQAAAAASHAALRARALGTGSVR